MKEKKNIERLFQEKFKDFEAIPPQDAWFNIEARLENNKKKRIVIPFWFKASGVAAILVISFWLYNQNEFSSFNNEIDNNNSVVKGNNESDQNFQNDNSSEIKNESEFESKVKRPENQDNYINSNVVVTETESSTKKLDEIENTVNKPTIKKDNLTNQRKINSEKEQVAFETTKNKTDSKVNQNKTLNSEKNSNDLVLDFNQVEKLVENNIALESNNNKTDLNTKTQPKQSNLILEQGENLEKELVAEKVKETNEDKNFVPEENVLVENLNEVIDTLKVNEALAELSEVSIDSTQVIVDADEKEENELEKLLKEKEEGKNADEKEEEKRNKWVVSTNAAPVYFNSFSENASPLDEKFVSNSKSYNNSISYGVGVEYNISKKISVRTGLNTFELNYDVNEVAFYQNVNSEHLKNVKENEFGKMLSVESKLNNSGNLISTSGLLVPKYEGKVNQQIGYIEVPLELSYKVLDKKFGIDVIGGMSTLFLQENTVSLKADGLQMKIGEANNLNNINFSGNFGLGFRYTFWKSFNANFQPILKYQFNTFSENSGDFKPYIVGLYTGLSYSF